MIDLYYWPTPNGHKVTLFLEEAGLDYTLKPVNIGKGAQFEPAFLQISPNNKMPAIVDHAPADGGAPQSVFESGAILLYLSEKTSRFLPRDARGRIAALEWLFWQMGGLGPMSGQMGHFNVYAPEKILYAIDRYNTEVRRLHGVLDKRLAEPPFSPATRTASPTWPATHGSRCTPTSAPITPISRTSSAGMTPSPPARPRSVLMRSRTSSPPMPASR